MSSPEFEIVSAKKALPLLEDSSYTEELTVAGGRIAAANLTVNAWENALGTRFGIEKDAEGSVPITFASATWKVLKAQYEAACSTAPREFYVRFNLSHLIEPPVVVARYFVPLAAPGRGRQALLHDFDYSVKTVAPGGRAKGPPVISLSRQVNGKPGIRPNPFPVYRAPDQHIGASTKSPVETAMVGDPKWFDS